MDRRNFLKQIAAVQAGLVFVPPAFFKTAPQGLEEISPGYLFNPEGAHRFYPDVINMIDLGLLESKPAYRVRYEYYHSGHKQMFAYNADTFKIDTVGKTKDEINDQRAADGVLAVKKLIESIESYDRVSASVADYSAEWVDV